MHVGWFPMIFTMNNNVPRHHVSSLCTSRDGLTARTQVILMLLVIVFVGVSVKILMDPHSVLWLEEYLDFWYVCMCVCVCVHACVCVCVCACVYCLFTSAPC